MTIQQALKKARKLWGKTACVEMVPKGAFIGDDSKWHEYSCCEHGVWPERCKVQKQCPADFFVITRDPLKLGRIKYPAAKYQVGKVMMNLFFEVRGTGSSFEAAFEEAAKHWMTR